MSGIELDNAIFPHVELDAKGSVLIATAHKTEFPFRSLVVLLFNRYSDRTQDIWSDGMHRKSMCLPMEEQGAI